MHFKLCENCNFAKAIALPFEENKKFLREFSKLPFLLLKA